MKVKVLVLWGLFWFASQLFLDKIWIIGDSKVLIDHMNRKTSINLGSIAHWLERIELLKNSFLDITFRHVYRERNTVADRLLKKGVNGSFGIMYYQLHRLDGQGAAGAVNFL